jgi:hypothetical protein
MMSTELNSGSPKPGEITSLAVLGARLTWSFAGPTAMLALIYGIVSQGNGWLTRLDGAFMIVLGLMVLGRWVDQRSGTSTTLTDKPSTSDHFKRYVVILLPAAVAAWALANVVGNHVLGGELALNPPCGELGPGLCLACSGFATSPATGAC